MRPDVLIVGQGLAGSLLGWALERAGIAFAMADGGHERAASSVAAGIVNPITGRRLVKSWRVDELLPLARATYREIGDAAGVHVWRDLRVRRFFADERERQVFRAKRGTGELAPYARRAEGGGGQTDNEDEDEDAFWIEDAGRVDVAALLRVLRERWAAAGVLRETTVRPEDEVAHYAAVVDCTGVAATLTGTFGFVPWEYSKGEVLEIATEGLDPGVVLNRRHWVMPVSETRAWVGATHEPGVTDTGVSAGARASLEKSARGLLGRDFVVTRQLAGVRVNLPDKLPVVGRHPGQPRLGLINGLGAKGALLAPYLAQMWVRHLRAGGADFPAEIHAARFAR